MSDHSAELKKYYDALQKAYKRNKRRLDNSQASDKSAIIEELDTIQYKIKDFQMQYGNFIKAQKNNFGEFNEEKFRSFLNEFQFGQDPQTLKSKPVKVHQPENQHSSDPSQRMSYPKQDLNYTNKDLNYPNQDHNYPSQELNFQQNNLNQYQMMYQPEYPRGFAQSGMFYNQRPARPQYPTSNMYGEAHFQNKKSPQSFPPTSKPSPAMSPKIAGQKDVHRASPAFHSQNQRQNRQSAP